MREQALDDLALLADKLRKLFDTFPDDPSPRLALEG
jgi:hypothetical protein